MRSVLLALLALYGTQHAAAQTNPPQCPFDAGQLSAQLGRSFKAGVPENAMIGKGCRYDAEGKGNVKLWVDAGPNPAPSAEMWRKMANPPGTGWKAVANDPDKAVHTIPKADVSPFPSLSYERKGWLVSITVSGIDNRAEIDAWNAKLVKLPRIP